MPNDPVAFTVGNRKLQQLHRQSQTRRLFKIQPCMRITRSCSRCTRIIILPESGAKGLEAKILIARCCYTGKDFFFPRDGTKCFSRRTNIVAFSLRKLPNKIIVSSGSLW